MINFPKAEWSVAKSILMHSPGPEIFWGMLHPRAALFDVYFDTTKVAKEHSDLSNIFKFHGIEVVFVGDVLMRVDINILRELAGSVLEYDLINFSAKETEIYGAEYKQEILYSMSRSDLIRILFLQPKISLHSTEINTKIAATYSNRPLMNLYFTRDQSIVTPKGAVICRMNSEQRMSETRIIRACYETLGMEPVFEIKGEGRLEGGDYLPAGDISFIGCGMRTNMCAIQQLMDADIFGHQTVVVVKDHLWWQQEMHLDTYFNLLDKDLCTIPRSRVDASKGSAEYSTADVYVKDATGKYRLNISDVGFVDLIQTLGITIIPIERGDEIRYANNFLTIAPRHIVAVAGQSEIFQKALNDNGVDVDWIDLTNLTCGFGAAHCMTQVLSRV